MGASNAGTSKGSNATEHELVITRVFDAPRELVFDAWTEAEHLKHWQGAPRGFTVTSEESDIRPGGGFRICMRSPEGVDHWLRGSYREIVRPERLVFSHAWLDAAGKPTQETLVTVTSVERGKKTEMTLRQSGFTSDEARDGHRMGWTSAFDVLSEYLGKQDAQAFNRSESRAALPRESEVTITRIFDAPREVVFKAWTDPKQLAKWFGPKGFTNPVCEVDARVGGAWHVVMRSPNGTEHPCGGVYREVVAPERLVFTNIATDKDGNPILDGLTTVIFAEHGGKTKLTLQTRATAVVEYATEHLKGMEAGWTQTLERLAEELARS